MAATYTPEEMYNNTQEAIYKITKEQRDETGTAGRKEIRLQLKDLKDDLIYWKKEMNKDAQTAAQKGPALVVFREIS